MANYDLSKIVADARAAVLPWDETIEINAQKFALRPLLVADLAAIGRMTEMSDEEGFVLLQGLFEPPGPPLREWHASGAIDNAQLLALANVAAAIYQRKNSEAIAGQVRAAMARTK